MSHINAHVREYDARFISRRRPPAQTTWRCAPWRCCSWRGARAARCWGWWGTEAARRVTCSTTFRLWATRKPCSAWNLRVEYKRPPARDISSSRQHVFGNRSTRWVTYSETTTTSKPRQLQPQMGLFCNATLIVFVAADVSCVKPAWTESEILLQPCRSSSSPSRWLSYLDTISAWAATLWANLQFSTSGSRARKRWAATPPQAHVQTLKEAVGSNLLWSAVFWLSVVVLLMRDVFTFHFVLHTFVFCVKRCIPCNVFTKKVVLQDSRETMAAISYIQHTRCTVISQIWW